MPTALPAASLTEADILAALRDCYDPEVSCNIVDLGLVYSVSVLPDPDAPGTGIPGVPARYRVHIDLIVAQIVDSEDTTLAAQIKNRLAAFETISRTEVRLLREPAWTPDRISPQGRKRISQHQQRNQPPNALVQIQTRPAKA
jgi:metal-sulfur cluster biosynthetic enzyme